MGIRHHTDTGYGYWCPSVSEVHPSGLAHHPAEHLGQWTGGDFPAAASVSGVTTWEERGLIRGTSLSGGEPESAIPTAQPQIKALCYLWHGEDIQGVDREVLPRDSITAQKPEDSFPVPLQSTLSFLSTDACFCSLKVNEYGGDIWLLHPPDFRWSTALLSLEHSHVNCPPVCLRSPSWKHRLPLAHPGAVYHTRPLVCGENSHALRRQAGLYLGLRLFLVFVLFLKIQ